MEALRNTPTPLLGCHQKFLLENSEQKRTLGSEGELEVTEDLIDDLKIFNK